MLAQGRLILKLNDTAVIKTIHCLALLLEAVLHHFLVQGKKELSFLFYFFTHVARSEESLKFYVICCC